MTSAMSRSVLAGAIFFLLAVGADARQAPGPAELAGVYYSGHRFGGSSIVLQADGAYTVSSSSCTFNTHESGTFGVDGGAVHFRVLKYTGSRNGVGDEVDLFDPKAAKEFFGYGDDREFAPPRTEYALLTVRWGERVYLIDEKELGNFAHAINLGLEPRSEEVSEHYFGSFHLRRGGELKAPGGSPSLPDEWRAFLLRKPVTAAIVGVEGEGEERVATIDKGGRHGLKVGMRLIGADEEPSLWSAAVLISVDERSAKIRVGPGSKVGDRLTTKYVRKDLYR